MVLSPKIVQRYSGVTTGGGSRLTAAATKKVKRPGALTVPGKRIKDTDKDQILYTVFGKRKTIVLKDFGFLG